MQDWIMPLNYCHAGYFADPDGHMWEVAWNPFTDLT
jgi:predicted lactoylglutathione lyase